LNRGGGVKEERVLEDDILDLAARVESLLFVADGPVSTGRLAEALEVTPGQVERALTDLEAVHPGRGLRLQRAGSLVQLITAPEAAPCVERFLGLEARTRLSRAALETLAIIAYRQPVTRPEIEAVRGVSSDSVLRTLLSVGLVEEVGRASTVGRPILYGTTFEFLQHFGLSSLDELPSLDSLPASEGV
jgi:segregation and condensation protein B